MRAKRWRNKGIFKITKEDKEKFQKDRDRKRLKRLEMKEKMLNKKLDKAKHRLEEFQKEKKMLSERK